MKREGFKTMETEMMQMEQVQEMEPQEEIEVEEEAGFEVSSMAPERMFEDANRNLLEFTQDELSF